VRIHYHKILLSVALLMNLVSYSQSQRFIHLSSEHGISQSEVYSFLHDSKGFIWIGTIDGLNRYDGYEIEVFNTERNNPNTLSNNTIRSLAEDHLGRIWIGTNDGLNLYDPKTELIHQISFKTFMEKRLMIWSILVYNDQLLLGTDNGLWVTNIQSTDLNKIENKFHQVKEIQSSAIIRSIIKSSKGGIWVFFNNGTKRIDIRNDNQKDSFL